MGRKRYVVIYRTVNEMLKSLGDALRAERLSQNLSQQTAADRSALSLKAVRNLENGENASLKTLMALCRTLKKTDWIVNLAPPEMDRSMFERKEPFKRRQRAAKRKEAANG